MKILYLAHSQIPSASANSIQVMQMCQAFGREHQVTLMARRSSIVDICLNKVFDYYSISKTFKVIFPWRLRLNPMSSMAGYMFLIKTLALQKPDICFGRHLKSLVISAKMGFPVIYEAHEVPKSRTEKVFIQQIYSSKKFMGIVFISNMLQQSYKCIFPDLPQGKTIVAHDGIDLDRFGRLDSVTPPEIKGNPDAFKAGYIGGLKPEKGIGLILSIAGMMPEMEFHLVGGNPSELEFWQSKASSMRNVFFYGQVNPEEAINYGRAFNFLLAPYEQASWRRESGCLENIRDETRVIGNSPLKFFEYMGCEKPILTSDIAISREIFTHGHDALLVDPDKPQKWVQSLSTLCSSPELAREMSANAREKANEHTWDKRAEKIILNLCSK